MSVKVEGETVEVVDVTRQLLDNLVASFPRPAATPESNHPVEPPGGKEGGRGWMELGGVDVAWVGELLLLPDGGGDLLPGGGGGGVLLRGGKLPNPSCPVSHCSSKLPLTLPGWLDVHIETKCKMRRRRKDQKKGPVEAELVNSAWQFAKASV